MPLRVDHTRNYLIAGTTDQIEIHVISLNKAIILLTDTGYRSFAASKRRIAADMRASIAAQPATSPQQAAILTRSSGAR